MNDDKWRELEALTGFGETSLWIEALAEDAPVSSKFLPGAARPSMAPPRFFPCGSGAAF